MVLKGSRNYMCLKHQQWEAEEADPKSSLASQHSQNGALLIW